MLKRTFALGIAFVNLVLVGSVGAQNCASSAGGVVWGGSRVGSETPSVVQTSYVTPAVLSPMSNTLSTTYSIGHVVAPTTLSAPGVPIASYNAPIVVGTVMAPTFVAPGPAQGNLLPYSYYLNAPSPSRVYVPYGPADQFPFHGQPYGHATDRWSWYNMGGGSGRYLANYYYPILH